MLAPTLQSTRANEGVPVDEGELVEHAIFVHVEMPFSHLQVLHPSLLLYEVP